jgi:hypothetical protein
MPRYDIDLIASAVVAELRRSGVSRSFGHRRRGPPHRPDTASMASEIAAALRAMPAVSRRGGTKPTSGFSQTVSAIASQVVARLALAPARDDLPMVRIEI